MNKLYIKNIILLLLSSAFLFFGFVVLFYVFTPLPDISIENISSRQSVIIEDRNGEFLFDFSENEKRTHTPYDEISENIINATIAVEDHLFFEHTGIRIDAFIRATIKNITSLSFSQGGSTITQQVVKNIFLTTEKKIQRKLKEFLLAKKVENILTKEEILELYLNTISYGGVIYGIGEASNSFFGKDASEITIAEAAYMAAIINAPTYFSPYGQNKVDLEYRKDLIIESMLRHGLITREEYEVAKNEFVHFQEQDVFSIQAPHFVFFVKEILEKEYGTKLKALEGSKIKTTIDLELQNEIEDIAYRFSTDFEKKYSGKNIAVVVLENKTGDILSMVGSRNFFEKDIDGGVNVTTSLRQPGSTFKPIAYAAAFESGLSPDNIIYDVPTQFAGWCDEDKFETTEDGCYSPVNYTGRFSGPVSLRSALAQSINIPAVKVLYLAGVDNVISLARKMGIASLSGDSQQYGLSLVLGGGEVKPIELAQAYSVFANNGVLVPYRWNREEETEKERVLPESVARNITSILSDDSARAPVFGYNSPLNIKTPPVAVKTGTTNNSRDVWVVGYSPDITVLVWGGNSNSDLLENDVSGFSLSPLFRDVVSIVSSRYGNKNSYFPVNTFDGGASVKYYEIDEEDPHSILHYIRSDKDSQYKNWEFAVNDWFGKTERNNSDGSFGVDGRNIKNFSIESPAKGIKLSFEENITIISKEISAKNTTYEFYVDGVLVGSSHLPFFSFNPKTTLKGKPAEINVKVVANSSIGVFEAEAYYEIE